jgi:hypothetical protein
MNWENEYKKMKRDNDYLRGMNKIHTQHLIGKDEEIKILRKALEDVNNFIKNLINRELK